MKGVEFYCYILLLYSQEEQPLGMDQLPSSPLGKASTQAHSSADYKIYLKRQKDTTLDLILRSQLIHQKIQDAKIKDTIDYIPNLIYKLAHLQKGPYKSIL